MSFTVQDFSHFVRVLTAHPEWRSELRRLVLTDELLALPELVRELVESQRAVVLRLGDVEVRLHHIEEQQTALAERQQRLEEQQQRFEERQAQFEVRQADIEERLGQVEVRLADVEERLANVEIRLAQVEERLGKVEVRLAEIEVRLEVIEKQLESNTREIRRLAGEFGNFKGKQLEGLLTSNPAQVLGRMFKSVRNVGRNIPDSVENALSADDFDEVLRLDALVVAQPRRYPEAGDVWLAIEISGAVDENDVTRAQRRASILRGSGLPAIPLVVGDSIQADGTFAARQQAVVTLIDQEFEHVAEAIAVHLKPA